MANTNYLKKDTENWIRDNWLPNQFPGQRFSKKILALSSGGTHEFDAVSEDYSIVAGITARSWKTKSGNLPSGKYDGLYAELYFLSLLQARKKLLILTHSDMYRDFINRSQGKVAPGVEIRFCQLPANIARNVDAVRRNASEEIA